MRSKSAETSESAIPDVQIVITMDNFDADLKNLEYRSKLDLPENKDRAL